MPNDSTAQRATATLDLPYGDLEPEELVAV